MEVRITLEDRASEENKHLLTWLRSIVGDFRQDMKMSVVTMPTEEKKARNLSLPMVVIGSRTPVYGGKNIIAEIKQARGTIVQMNLSDPVEQVWRDAMRKRPDEKPEGGTGQDELAQQFTNQTSLRQRMEEQRRSRAGSRPLPPAAKPVPSGEGPARRVPSAPAPGPARRTSSAPQTTAERISQSASQGDFTSDDPDQPANMETDPWMRKYWQSQTLTAGV